MSRPCKHETCPECSPLLHQVTTEDEPIKSVVAQEQYLEYFDGYIEEAEDDSDQFPSVVSLNINVTTGRCVKRTQYTTIG